MSRRSACRAAALLTALGFALTGCTFDAPDAALPERPAAGGSAGPALTLAQDRRPRESVALHACVSLGFSPDAYSRPVLLWLRVRVSEPVRLRPMAMDVTSNGIEYVEQYVAPDKGAAAPHLAVSLGPTPDGELLEEHASPRLLGDPRARRAGVAAAMRAWEARKRFAGRRLPVGDHYLFARVTLEGRANLNGLSVTWSRPGEPTQTTPVGWLLFRAHCGG